MYCYHTKREIKKSLQFFLRYLFFFSASHFPQSLLTSPHLNFCIFLLHWIISYQASSFAIAEVTWNKRAAVIYHNHTYAPSLVRLLLTQENSNSLISTNPDSWFWNIYTLNNILNKNWLSANNFPINSFKGIKRLPENMEPQWKMTSVQRTDKKVVTPSAITYF